MIYIDLDDFKEINDRLGTWFGDFVLGQIGQMLLNCTERAHCVARWEADCFVMLVQGTEKEVSEEVIGQIREENRLFSERYEFSSPLTMSFGINRCRKSNLAFEEVLQRAIDAASYVKACGKDSYAFYLEVKNALGKEEAKFEGEDTGFGSEDLLQLTLDMLKRDEDPDRLVTGILETICRRMGLDAGRMRHAARNILLYFRLLK